MVEPAAQNWLKFSGPPGGRAHRRTVGRRARLTVEEAAVLGRPREYVERAFRTGFLRPVQDSRRPVTLRACVRFLQEEE